MLILKKSKMCATVKVRLRLLFLQNFSFETFFQQPNSNWLPTVLKTITIINVNDDSIIYIVFQVCNVRIFNTLLFP